MSNNFSLDISYYQISLFDPSFKNSFNDWGEKETSQGFSWLPGSVSCRSFNNGALQVIINESNSVKLKKETKRAISVPFKVGQQGIVEVASIPASKQIKIAPGSYTVIYEHGYAGTKICCNFTFVLKKNTTPPIFLP